MNFKLINSEITENYATNLLKERGVQDIANFLSPSEKLLNNFLDLCNIKEGAQLLLDTLKDPNHNILFIVDCDVDGFTSSAILWQYILKINSNANLHYKIHLGKNHGLEDLMTEIIDDNSATLIILPDAGSNEDKNHIKISDEIGCSILVLDHHEIDVVQGNLTKTIIINNQISPNYKNKSLTGAGIVWQFCRYLDSILNFNYANDYIDLAALGGIADMQNVLELENRFIIKQGLENINNLFLKLLIEKQAFSLGERLSPIGIAFYIAPMLNALIRVGTINEKSKLFQGFINGDQIVSSTKKGDKGNTEMLATQLLRDCTNARNHQNKAKEDAVANLEVKISNNNLLENKILFIRLEDDDNFPAELNGLISMQLAAKYKRPTIVARLNDTGFIRGSARGLDKSTLKDFKTFVLNSGLFEYALGHSMAFGTSIKDSNLRKFHEYANINLEDCNFDESSFDVNFVFNSFDEISDLIYDLDTLVETYGQGNPTPLVVVQDLHLNKKNITTMMGKNKNTTKFEYNGIIYMLFGDKDFVAELEKQPILFDLDIIGETNVNNYMGRTTPQIMIKSWEFKPSMLSEF